MLNAGALLSVSKGVPWLAHAFDEAHTDAAMRSRGGSGGLFQRPIFFCLRGLWVHPSPHASNMHRLQPNKNRRALQNNFFGGDFTCVLPYYFLDKRNILLVPTLLHAVGHCIEQPGGIGGGGGWSLHYLRRRTSQVPPPPPPPSRRRTFQEVGEKSTNQFSGGT